MDNLDIIDFYKTLGNFILMKRTVLYNIKKKAESFPSEVQIQTINNCNGSCQMCPNAYIQNKKHEIMSNKLFEKIIREMSEEKSGYAFLEFMCQNEPLMDKDLFKKIRLVKEIGKKGIITMVVTNGNLFTTKKIKELEDSGLDILNFSIDALTEETYNKIRVGLNYKSVLKNIENVINSNYKNCLLVSFVKQKDNIGELKEFKRYWKNKGISTLAFTVCNRSGGVRDFENFELQNQDYSILNPFFSYIWKKIAKCCITPLAEFIILWNGDVLLCCNDYSKKLVLGNVNDSSIKEIWNGEEYKKIRELHFNGEYKKISICSNCSIKRNNYL